MVYRLYRRLGTGDYEQVAELAGLTYDDGPLDDGVYTHQVLSVDVEGDSASSNEAATAVSTVPDPPGNLAWNFAADTKTLTLTWDASPSSDVSSYRVRSSDGESWLDPTGTRVQDSADLSYEQIFTTETGLFIFSVRAVDTDGNEESNVSEMVSIPFENGAPVATLADGAHGKDASMRLYLINPSNPLVSIVKVKESRWNRYRVWKPLSLMVLAGLTPPEWEVSILDENLGAPDYRSMPRPDLVGITAFTSQANRAYEVASHFRRVGVPVVMGGRHAARCGGWRRPYC